jgi:WD40 repeat protein
VLGLGGIGKTMLAAKIVEQVRHNFNYIIWRSLRNSPKLNDILRDIVQLQNFECYQLRGHEGRIRSVAFTPYVSSCTGTLTLASGSADRKIKLWAIQNFNDGKELFGVSLLTGCEARSDGIAILGYYKNQFTPAGMLPKKCL